MVEAVLTTVETVVVTGGLVTVVFTVTVVVGRVNVEVVLTVVVEGAIERQEQADEIFEGANVVR